MPDPKPGRLARIDLGHTGGAPTIRVWTAEGHEHTYELNPSEAAAIVRRLAGALQQLLGPTHDRTDETRAANPEVFNRDQEPAA